MKNPIIVFSEQWKNEVWLCFWWTPEEYSEYLKSQWVSDYSAPDWAGETTVISSWWILIWVAEKDELNMLLTLNHEIFHAVDYLLRKKVWITLSDDSDEVYAYTIAYFQSKFYKELNLWIQMQ